MSKANWLKYGITGAVCLVLVVFYAGVRDFFAQELMEKFRILCDGFTVAGTLCLMGGVMVWVTNQGALDGIGYALSYTFKALTPGGRMGKAERYYDYVQRKREKCVSGYSFLFVVGGVCMAIAIVFMVLFYRLYGK